MSGFYHGTKTLEVPTGIVPPQKAMSALTIVFGCAPIHRLSAGDQAKVMPGKIALVFGMAEAGARLGIDVQRDDFTHWTLSEDAYSRFLLFNVSPVVYANLFDPSVHRQAVANEIVTLAAGKGKLAHADLIGEAAVIPENGGAAYVPDVDYHLDALTGAVTVLEGGALESVSAVQASYVYAAPELVTDAECIGGYDVVTGKVTGLSLIDQVYPQFREVPAIVIAPKFGETPAVAAIMRTKITSQGGVGYHKGIAIADVPCDGSAGVTLYTDVPAYKQKTNLALEGLYLCWPKIKFGGKVFRMSTQAASLIAHVDATHDGIPFASPSNKNLQMDGAVVDGEEVFLDLPRANYLNGNGIATVLNRSKGWKLWGNRMSCYPDNTDPKDSFITGRRMMCWYGNHLTNTWWEKLDDPMTRRLAETITNSEQCELNALTSSGKLHGGRIALLEEENHITDLMDGQIVWHVYLGLIPPAERIYFNMEYDPYYIKTIFGSN